ncbi:MAG: helix-turn-helix domain-containing protein, partial [Muribaculaceae bacterium]|nr:helix-turn-helix domain-containing protein [Muribaculaceae bacterium]
SLVRVVSQSSDIQGYLFEVSLDFMLPAVQRVMDVSHILYIRDNPLLSLAGDDASELRRQIEGLSHSMPVECDDEPGLEKIASEIVKSRAYTLLYELLYLYFRRHTVTIGDKGRHNMVLQNFVVHLFSHYRHEREVSFYAGLQNMTPRYFSSIIKEQSGRPASMWINNLVISQMRQMLDDPALSVKEVSARFNFPSQSFFGKYFKLHAGMSPKEYRRGLASGAG